jgi:hypothetical protein
MILIPNYIVPNFRSEKLSRKTKGKTFRQFPDILIWKLFSLSKHFGDGFSSFLNLSNIIIQHRLKLNVSAFLLVFSNIFFVFFSDERRYEEIMGNMRSLARKTVCEAEFVIWKVNLKCFQLVKLMFTKSKQSWVGEKLVEIWEKCVELVDRSHGKLRCSWSSSMICWIWVVVWHE